MCEKNTLRVYGESKVLKFKKYVHGMCYMVSKLLHRFRSGTQCMVELEVR